MASGAIGLVVEWARASTGNERGERGGAGTVHGELSGAGRSLGSACGAGVTLSDEQRRLVRENLGLVGVHLRLNVRGLRRRIMGREWEELFQEGCLGLIRAALRFREESGIPFAAFALPRIHNAVSDALRRGVPRRRRKRRRPASESANGQGERAGDGAPSGESAGVQPPRSAESECASPVDALAADECCDAGWTKDRHSDAETASEEPVDRWLCAELSAGSMGVCESGDAARVTGARDPVDGGAQTYRIPLEDPDRFHFRRADRRRRDPRHWPSEPRAEGARTVGDRLHEVYHTALDSVCAAAAKVPGTRGDRPALVRVISEERLAIPCPHSRRPLWQIARETKSSFARVHEAEQSLKVAMKKRLNDDAEFRELRRWLKHTPHGADEVMVDEHGRRLLERGAKDPGW